MRRLALAVCLAAVAVSAQAQTFDDRFPKSTPGSPSLVTAVRNWLSAKTTPATREQSQHPLPVTAGKTVATGKTAPPATVTETAATETTAAATTTAEIPMVPHVVTALTVVNGQPATEKSIHAKSACETGDRIISAFYWEGRRTATGERFNPEGMTAAHRTFAFGTRLLVTNPRTGKSVTVTVNDRGPFTRGVSLDLTRGAARAIGLQGTGAVCMAKL